MTDYVVRNLYAGVIRNLCLQGKAPDEVVRNIDDVNEVLTEALEELHR